MKKTGLFKIIMFVLLGIVLLTWVFSASYYSAEESKLVEAGMYNIGFFDYFQLLLSSFRFDYFIQIAILLVSIGALYGVLGKTGKYRAWIERISKSFKGTETVFLLVAAFIIAALSSVFDYGLILFIFFPLLISIILAMGYDKITACLATIGAMLIGTIGNTLGYNTSKAISEILDVTVKSGIYYRIGLFVLAFAALALFLIKAKPTAKVENTKASSKKDVITYEDDLFLGEKNSNKYSIFPIITIFTVLLIIIVLGCTNWKTTFNIDVFEKYNTEVTSLSVKLPYFHVTSEGVKSGMQEVKIFSKILGNVNEFGSWYYLEMSVMCLLASILTGLFYGMSLKDRFAAMAEGAKKMIRPALTVMLVYIVIFFAGNTMFYPTIAKALLSITGKFNLFFSTIAMTIGSALHVDFLYVANYVIPQIAAQDANSTVLSILFQGIYGATMFVAPTSAVLALGLSYLDVSYKEWIKKTWKLILLLFAIVILVMVLAM